MKNDKVDINEVNKKLDKIWLDTVLSNLDRANKILEKMSKKLNK